MGNRVKGKPKRKSIKAASHSNMGSQRKLSRMGKVRKKHHSGLDATFIGRSQCLKRLQISLKDFRRLCILKGVYPREPHNGKVPKKNKAQVYYHIKDLKALAHEPVLEKFRDFRAFMKKVRRAAGRLEKDEAARKHALAHIQHGYTLHHLVRERYPRFIDALADLDDALTLVFLFAALPAVSSSSSKKKEDGSSSSSAAAAPDIPPKVITSAKGLAAAWNAYCTMTSTITKGFISVKGIYMEAVIHNTTIRWIIPHAFVQYMPGGASAAKGGTNGGQGGGTSGIDYKVMLTFMEFYETLLSFVLFRLYHEMGVRYPLVGTTTTTTTTYLNAAASNTRRGNHKVPVGTSSLLALNGSTSAIMAQNLRALHKAFGGGGSSNNNNNSAADNGTQQGGVVSQVVSESLQQQQQQDGVGDHDTDDNDTNGKRKKKKKLSRKTKELLQTVGDALEGIDEEEEEEDGLHEDDDDVDVAQPLGDALHETLMKEDDDNNDNTKNRDTSVGAAGATATEDSITAIIVKSEGNEQDDVKKRRRLFAGLVFFFSREVPRGYLEMVALAFGATQVGWDGPGSPIPSPFVVVNNNNMKSGGSRRSTTNNNNTSVITHYIVDRPMLPNQQEQSKSCEYVQPQWILDCANHQFLLPVERYRIGVSLPPHLSPWVNDEEEGYIPEYAKEIERLKNGEDVVLTLPASTTTSPSAGDDAGAGVVAADVTDNDDEDIPSEEAAAAAAAEGTTNSTEESRKKSESEKADEEEESEEEEDEEEEEGEDEEEMTEGNKSKKQRREAAQKTKEAEEQHAMAKVMMSKKAARLYGRMQHGIAAKLAKVEKLEQRRQDIKGKTKDDDGKSVLKQKVDRLKKERKSVENKYDDTGGSMKKKKNKKDKKRPRSV